jgi:hypothetical protein
MENIVTWALPCAGIVVAKPRATVDLRMGVQDQNKEYPFASFAGAI